MKKTVVMNYDTIVSIMYATQQLNKLNNVFYSNTVGNNDSMFTEINDTIFYLFESYISEALSVSETVKKNYNYSNEVIKLFDNISFHLVNGNIIDSGGGVSEVSAETYDRMCFGESGRQMIDPTCIVVRKK